MQIGIAEPAFCSRQCLLWLAQGREDLRLDERLMQALACANGLLRACPAAAHRRLHARTFAVVPLGPRTGLIQWVEHTGSLFGLLQAWQRRALGAGAAGKLPSPAEAFYGRLLPALKVVRHSHYPR